MNPTGFEEPDLSYAVSDEEIANQAYIAKVCLYIIVYRPTPARSTNFFSGGQGTQAQTNFDHTLYTLGWFKQSMYTNRSPARALYKTLPKWLRHVGYM